MTNTLHRYSEHYAVGAPRHAEPIRDDYIVFAMASQGINDDDLVEKYRTFLRLALKYQPINIGDATKGGSIRPRPDLNPSVHWRRDHRPDPQRVMAEIEGHTTVAAVFDNYAAMEKFVEELKAADLGISINISAPIDEAKRCCDAAGIARHSVEYSIGFSGRVDKLPEATTLELSTMCGHGMVSANFAKKMLEWVRENRRTPEEAARYMARFCSCGVFNMTRAESIMKRVCNRK
jgi:hypothetical protein